MAADRGLRVRVLIDDLGTMPSDRNLLALDSHPNIEVRFSIRWLCARRKSPALCLI